MENGTVIDSTAVPVNTISLAGVLRIPAVKQIMLLVGVAAAVAAGLAVFLWAQTPGYVQISSGSNSAAAADIVASLRASNIDFKINGDGSISVDESKLQIANMQLATQGLTEGDSSSILKDKSISDSQYREQMMFQMALEKELEKTISTFTGIRSANVQLALPRQTGFLRDKKKATASVAITMGSGQVLEASQAKAIANMVAQSVPNLSANDVAIVDQYMRSLNMGGIDTNEVLAASQLDYQMTLEQNLRSKLEELLMPLVGFGKVRAQVSADIDFSQREVATVNYDSANAAVISRQVSESSANGSGSNAAGVPGALSNQPPDTGGTTASEGEQVAQQNMSRQSTENYEVPVTTSYEKPQPATIRRLTVAILVDDSVEEGAADATASTGLSQAQIDKMTTLAQQAVGFNAARGDTLTIINEPFAPAEVVEPMEPPAIWEKPIVRDIAKQVLGAAIVLAIVFGVVRPMLKNVVASHAEAAQQVVAGGYPAGVPQVAGGAPAAAIPPPNFDEKVAAARNISGHDPARVAQVVKQWVGDNG